MDSPRILPKSVFVVTLSYEDDDSHQSLWYDRAKADARVRELNAEVYKEAVANAKQVIDRWTPQLAEVNDFDIGYFDARHVAAYAKDREVRAEAAAIRDAFHHDNYGDPRDPIAMAQEVIDAGLDGFMAHPPIRWAAGARLWRVEEWTVSDG